MGLLANGWGWPGTNPLIRFGASVDVDLPFDPDEITAVSSLHRDREMRNQFPRRNDQQVLSFQIPTGILLNRTPAQRLGGVMFDKVQPDGTQSPILNVAGNRIVFQTSEYRRWHVISPMMADLFTKVATKLTQPRRIVGLQLDFVNRLIFDGPNESANVSDVLADSQFIAKHALESVGLWHSHHGFLESSEAVAGAQWTRNLQVQLIDLSLPNLVEPFRDEVNPRRCLDVSIFHRLSLENESSVVLPPSDGAALVAFTSDAFSQARNRNRSIFRSLVLPAVSNAIDGLGDH